MLTLYQFEPALGLPNTSPFCMKLETYLRMTGLDYQVDTSADVRKAPKGKLPYIEDQGKIIPDSNFILDYLKTTYGNPLDEHLSDYDAAIALGMQRLIEEQIAAQIQTFARLFAEMTSDAFCMSFCEIRGFPRK